MKTNLFSPEATSSKKIVLTLVGLMLLLAVPAFGEGEGCQKEQLFSKLRAQSDYFNDDGAYEIDTSLLFYQLSSELQAGKDQVRLEARQNGRDVLAEDLTLIAEDSALFGAQVEEPSFQGTVVEFLSTAPAERARLRTLIEQGEIDLLVLVNGVEFEKLTFSDLEARSDDLRETMPAPHAISSQLTLPNNGEPITLDLQIPLKGACENGCYAQHDYCSDQCVWVPNSGPCFDACDDDLDYCLFDCSGQCNPSTTTSTTTQLVQTTILNPIWTCIKPGMSAPADYYRWTRLKYKVTTTTTTTNADCSVTVTTQVTYPFVYCWLFTNFGPCMQPQVALNICL